MALLGYFLPPYAAAPGIEPTSRRVEYTVELPQTGTFEGHATDWATAPWLETILNDTMIQDCSGFYLDECKMSPRWFFEADAFEPASSLASPPPNAIDVVGIGFILSLSSSSPSSSLALVVDVVDADWGDACCDAGDITASRRKNPESGSSNWTSSALQTTPERWKELFD